MNIRRILIPTAMLWIGWAGMVQAQFAEDALRFSQLNGAVGARALGMGNVGIGFANDYNALFTNPAGLALERNFEFSLGLSRNGISNDVGYLGTRTTSSEGVLNLNNLGLVYPVPTTRGSLTFAFGFGRTAGFNSTAEFSAFNGSHSIVRSLAPFTDLYTMSLEEEQQFLDDNIPFQLWLADTADGYLFPIVTDSVQQSGTVVEGGGINHWSFGGAMDIARNVSLGVSLNFASGSYTYDREFVEEDVFNVYRYGFPYNFQKFTYVNTIQSDLSGFNLLLGLMYRQPGKFRVGFAVRTPTVYSIEETFSDAGRSRFKDGTTYDITFDAVTKYRVTTPSVVSAGVAIEPTDWLVLAGDAEYTDWTEMQFGREIPELEEENRFIRKIFRETVNLRGGGEVTLWDLGLRLRGGVTVTPSPFKGDPSSFDQVHFSAGVGYMVDESTTINAGFSQGTWKTFRDNYSLLPTITAASRTSENVTSGTVNVTLSYRF